MCDVVSFNREDQECEQATLLDNLQRPPCVLLTYQQFMPPLCRADIPAPASRAPDGPPSTSTPSGAAAAATAEVAAGKQQATKQQATKQQATKQQQQQQQQQQGPGAQNGGQGPTASEQGPMSEEGLRELVRLHAQYLQEALGAPLLPAGFRPPAGVVLGTERCVRMHVYVLLCPFVCVHTFMSVRAYGDLYASRLPFGRRPECAVCVMCAAVWVCSALPLRDWPQVGSAHAPGRSKHVQALCKARIKSTCSTI